MMIWLTLLNTLGGCDAFVLDGVLSEEECGVLRNHAEGLWTFWETWRNAKQLQGHWDVNTPRGIRGEGYAQLSFAVGKLGLASRCSSNSKLSHLRCIV